MKKLNDNEENQSNTAMIGAIASIMIICLFGIFCYFCFFKKDSYSLPTESVSKTKVQMLCTPDDLEKALKSGVMAEGIAIKPKKKKHSNQENSSSESSSDDDSAASARSNFSQSDVKRIQKGKKVSDQHLTAAIVKANTNNKVEPIDAEMERRMSASGTTFFAKTVPKKHRGQP